MPWSVAAMAQILAPWYPRSMKYERSEKAKYTRETYLSEESQFIRETCCSETLRKFELGRREFLEVATAVIAVAGIVEVAEGDNPEKPVRLAGSARAAAPRATANLTVVPPSVS